MLKTILLLNSALLITNQIEKDFNPPYELSTIIKKAIKQLHKQNQKMEQKELKSSLNFLALF